MRRANRPPNGVFLAGLVGLAVVFTCGFISTAVAAPLENVESSLSDEMMTIHKVGRRWIPVRVRINHEEETIWSVPVSTHGDHHELETLYDFKAGIAVYRAEGENICYVEQLADLKFDQQLKAIKERSLHKLFVRQAPRTLYIVNATTDLTDARLNAICEGREIHMLISDLEQATQLMEENSETPKVRSKRSAHPPQQTSRSESSSSWESSSSSSSRNGQLQTSSNSEKSQSSSTDQSGTKNHRRWETASASSTNGPGKGPVAWTGPIPRDATVTQTAGSSQKTYTWKVTDANGYTTTHTYTGPLGPDRTPVRIQMPSELDVGGPSPSSSSRSSNAQTGPIPRDATVTQEAGSSQKTYTWKVKDANGYTTTHTYTGSLGPDRTPIRIQMPSELDVGGPSPSISGRRPVSSWTGPIPRDATVTQEAGSSQKTYTWKVKDANGYTTTHSYTGPLGPDRTLVRIRMPSELDGGGTNTSILSRSSKAWTGPIPRDATVTQTPGSSHKTYTWKVTDANGYTTTHTYTGSLGADRIPIQLDLVSNTAASSLERSRTQQPTRHLVAESRTFEQQQSAIQQRQQQRQQQSSASQLADCTSQEQKQQRGANIEDQRRAAHQEEEYSHQEWERHEEHEPEEEIGQVESQQVLRGQKQQRQQQSSTSQSSTRGLQQQQRGINVEGQQRAAHQEEEYSKQEWEHQEEDELEEDDQVERQQVLRGEKQQRQQQSSSSQTSNRSSQQQKQQQQRGIVTEEQRLAARQEENSNPEWEGQEELEEVGQIERQQVLQGQKQQRQQQSSTSQSSNRGSQQQKQQHQSVTEEQRRANRKEEYSGQEWERQEEHEPEEVGQVDRRQVHREQKQQRQQQSSTSQASNRSSQQQKQQQQRGIITEEQRLAARQEENSNQELEHQEEHEPEEEVNQVESQQVLRGQKQQRQQQSSTSLSSNRGSQQQKQQHQVVTEEQRRGSPRRKF
ncbi:uncharacterized protein LOC130698608 [Daphnia carinata]|uniref:uncharacterized protein LOC130698608 n=1 Tax=Daphnia carinata TaxID=120202 RepID=UPI00257BDD97|nr:uncharacterized protein LOC130698608 [Daphnia carinata]